jgi:transcriptional regulator with GAF, ATPase, and Fis domain
MNASGANAAARQAQDSRGRSIEPSVARDLSEMARQLQSESDSGAVMQRIVDAAVREIPGAVGAAITLLDHEDLSSPAHTDERARLVGLAQAETGEGPCVDTSRTERTLRVDDLCNDPRWPKWGQVAADNGVLGVMSFQLFVEEHSMGALDVYAAEAMAFDDNAENIGLLLAAHAGVALADRRKIENLNIAMDSRDLIGQAKGILMERYKIDAGKAFDLLVYGSQHLHRKLRDLAEDIASSGEFPPQSGT